MSTSHVNQKNKPTAPQKAPVKTAPVAQKTEEKRRGRAPMSAAEKAESQAKTEAKVAAFKALSPVGKAKVYLDNAWKHVERLGESLMGYDKGDAIKAAISNTTEELGAILDHLKGLPDDFKPARAKGGGRGPSKAFAEGSEIYFRNVPYAEKFSKNFPSQGPHRILEVTPDGEFVMLQGSKYVIGIPRNLVSTLTPEEQTEALADWHRRHPDGLKGKSTKN